MKIYFAGSIRGGREKVQDYIKIVNELKKYGKVLTEHVANPDLSTSGEDMTPQEIYERDRKWLEECDIVFAEISLPSLGVGYEIAYAEKLGKKVICMYEQNKNVSGMIRGNKNFEMITYTKVDELLEEIRKILEM